MQEADGNHSTRRGVLHALAGLGVAAAMPVPARAAEPSPIGHLGALFEEASRAAQSAMDVEDERAISVAMRRLAQVGHAMDLFEPRGTDDRDVIARRDRWSMTSPCGVRSISIRFGGEGECA